MNQVTLNTLAMCEAALKHAYQVLDYAEYPELLEELEGAMLVAGLTIDEIAATPNYLAAYQVWQEKTEWVQETAKPKELDMHRADVLRKRIEDLETELLKLKEQK